MKLAILLFAVGLSGCASIQASHARQHEYDSMMSYLGKPRDLFVQKHGPPSECSPLDAGGQVCVWKSSLSVYSSRSGLYGNRYAGLYGGGSASGISGERNVIFVYDKNNIAVHWTIKPVNNRTYSDTDSRDSL